MMKKRILSIIMIVSLLSTCLVCFSVNAESVPTVSFVNDSAEPSDNLCKVNVCLSDNPGITSLIVDISFDGDSIELIKADDSGNFSEWRSDSPNGGNNFRLVWEGDLLKENITFNGVVATLLFDVSGAENGEYPITATIEDGIDAVLDCKGNNVFFDAVGCTLTVEHKTETEQLSFRDDGDHYTVIGIGTVTGSSVDIPEEINGKPVTKIEEGAFNGCTDITEVVIPKTVTEIGEGAFEGCEELENVTYEGTPSEWEQVISSGGNDILEETAECKFVDGRQVVATGYCGADDSAVYDSESRAFRNLTWTLYDDGILVITGKGRMLDYSNIDGVTTAPWGQCSSMIISVFIGDVEIPVAKTLLASEFDGIIIGKYAFYGCEELIEIELGENVEEIKSFAFAECPELEGEIKLEEGLKTIGESAFGNCEKVTAIVIPSTVEEIAADAFVGITELTVSGEEGSYAEEWAKENKVEYVQNTAKYSIKGQITSYCPMKEATVRLKSGGAVKYTVKTATKKGTTLSTVEFVIENVEPGKYDLTVTKEGNLTYTVTGVVVTDKDIDLTKSDKKYSDITLIAGDVDGDGLVNGKDVQEVRLAGNINHNVSEATNALADVDGDGLINGKDVQVIRLVTNINKGTTDCTFAY